MIDSLAIADAVKQVYALRLIEDRRRFVVKSALNLDTPGAVVRQPLIWQARVRLAHIAIQAAIT